jgi:hypothetical protein
MGNKIHWNKWRKLCSLKQNGGIGFRDFHFFNLAMLVKQGCRLTNNNSSLVHRVYKAKYFPKLLIFGCEIGLKSFLCMQEYL